jgi:hypothetical protein
MATAAQEYRDKAATCLRLSKTMDDDNRRRLEGIARRWLELGHSVGSGVKREREMDDPFRQTRDPRMRADRYQRLARQYFDLAKEASSPSLRSDYQRTAEEYRVRAQGELRLLERNSATATARP